MMVNPPKSSEIFVQGHEPLEKKTSHLSPPYWRESHKLQDVVSTFPLSHDLSVSSASKKMGEFHCHIPLLVLRLLDPVLLHSSLGQPLRIFQML